MLISAKNYWTKILPMCIKKTCTIPKEFYYLLTPLKTLQEKINTEVIKEYINDAGYLKELIEEILYTKGLARRMYHITSSYNTDEVENIIKTVFNVTYIDDEHVRLERY